MLSLTCQIDQKKSFEANCLVVKVAGSLGKEWQKFDKGDGVYHIPYQMTNEFLKLMVRTGGLSFEGKEIVVDLLGRGEPLLPCRKSGEGERLAQIQGAEIRLAGVRLSLRRPSPLVYQGTLFKIDPARYAVCSS